MVFLKENNIKPRPSRFISICLAIDKDNEFFQNS